jgi:hypothetical protein
MRSNGNDGERLAARFTSEGAMSETEVRDDVDDSRISLSEAGSNSRAAKARAKKVASKSIAPAPKPVAVVAAVPGGPSDGADRSSKKASAKRAKAKSTAPKSRRAPASTASKTPAAPAVSESNAPAPISMDPHTTLRDHPGQKSLAKAARAATASTPPARRDDQISIPPTSSDPPGDLDERFFAEGEAAAHAAHVAHAEELARKQTNRHPPGRAVHELDSRRLEVVVPPERRQRLANYVKIAVGFSAVLCLAAVARVGLSHVTRSSAAEHAVVAAQIAPLPIAPKPIQPVAVPAALPEPPPAPSQAQEEPAAVAEPAVPAKSAKEEKEAARTSLERGKRQDAIDAAGRSVELDPTDAEAWLILGSAQQDSGHWKVGRDAYSECVKQAKVGPIGECRMMLR